MRRDKAQNTSHVTLYLRYMTNADQNTPAMPVIGAGTPHTQISPPENREPPACDTHFGKQTYLISVFTD